MIWVDVHAHPGYVGANHLGADADELMALQRRAGVTVTILSAIEAITGELKDGNERCHGVAATQADAAMFLVLSPVHMTTSLALLDRYSDSPRVVGVKIHPRLGGYNVLGAASLALLREVERRGLPLLSHTVGTQIPEPVPDLCTIYQLRELAERLPGIPVVAAHLGMTDHLLSGAEQVTSCRTGNLYLDTAAIELVHRRLLLRLVEIAGSDRILFGTDSPIHDPVAFRAAVERAGLSDPDLQAVAGGNALRLLPKLSSIVQECSQEGGPTWQ